MKRWSTQIVTANELSSTINMKKILSLLLTISLVVPVQAFGECNKPVVTLNQGEAAPCKGFLFTPAQEQQVRLIDEDYKLLQQKLELKDKQIDLFKKDVSTVDFMIQKEQDKAELWRKAAEDSTKQLVEVKEGQGKRDWLMILAGVALTIGAGYAVGQAANHK